MKKIFLTLLSSILVNCTLFSQTSITKENINKFLEGTVKVTGLTANQLQVLEIQDITQFKCYLLKKVNGKEVRSISKIYAHKNNEFITHDETNLVFNYTVTKITDKTLTAKVKETGKEVTLTKK